MPALLSPADGAGGVDPESSFGWTAVEWATRYDLQLANNPGFSPLSLEAVATDTLFTPPDPLQRSRLYYWRTRGVNDQGVGPWSEAFSFSTAGIVGTESETAAEFALSTRRPSPARGAIAFWLDLPEASRVHADGALSSGRHAMTWGAGVPAGVYVVRAQVWGGGTAGTRRTRSRSASPWSGTRLSPAQRQRRTGGASARAR